MRKGREYWLELVAEFEASPCRHEEFASRHGVRVGAFRQWLYRARAQRKQSVEGPKFVEVSLASSKRTSGGGCTVVLGSAEVRFDHLPSASYLSDLLSRAGQ